MLLLSAGDIETNPGPQSENRKYINQVKKRFNKTILRDSEGKLM